MGCEGAARHRQTVPIEDLEIDWGVQPRYGPPDPADVAAYAADMGAGDEFPPVVAFATDDGRLLLADGRNRRDAAEARGESTIDCLVIEGTREEAIEYAAGCNTRHGKKRSREDLEKAIENLFTIPKYAEISDREIGALARCHHQIVGSVRRRLTEAGSLAPAGKTKGKDGKLRKQPKPAVRVNGRKAEAATHDVERLVSGLELPEGATVEIVTHGGARGGPAAAVEDAEPFDPEQTELGQLLPSQIAKDGKPEYGPSMKLYVADAKAYMDPVIWGWLQSADGKVREAVARHCSRARKGNHNHLPPFLLRLEMLLRVRDVGQWRLCEEKNGGCGGAGQLPGSGTCPKCKGDGYRT